MLKLDPTIGPFVSDNPSFTFKQAKSLRDQLVMSEYLGGGGKRDPCKHPGAFRYGGCSYCQFMNTAKKYKIA